MARHIRKGAAQTGLVLANGGLLSYQHVVCLSSKPRRDNSPYPDKNPLPERTTDWYVPDIEQPADGEARIEVRFPLYYFSTAFFTTKSIQTRRQEEFEEQGEEADNL